jgi:glucose/arabinose dehydrogenase
MLKYLSLSAILAIFFFDKTETHTPKADNPAQKTYKTFCASCHGEQVEMFVDRQWKHGNSKAEIINSIANGWLDNGMPSWKQSLKPAEIDALADLIVKGIEEGKKFRFTDKPSSNVFKQENITIKLDTVVSGLSSPWGMAFLPNNEMLVTDRNGDMYRIGADRKKTKLVGVPEVVAQGQGGLLDVILHPKYPENHLIYISYSIGKKVGEDLLSSTAVMRAKLEGNQLTEQKNIFIAEPFFKTRHHYGSRLQFDKKGYLYVAVGERGKENENPQLLDHDGGKIHRIKDDGSIPSDNPFVNKADAHPSIYSWGHRNPQALQIHPETGVIWETEHGPRGGDELNIIKPSLNYGWPVISYGINYDGKPITNLTAKEGMAQPQHYWIPSIGPSGMTFVTSDKYKGWKGDLLMGSLRFKYLNRSKIVNNKVVKQEILLKNIGRLRDVRLSPDGYIYVSVEDPGYVFRLIPMN